MKNIFLVTISLFFISGKVFSQTDISLHYAETITREGLNHQLTVIASEEMEGRETGTQGQRKAATYIETQFKKIGLLPPPLLGGYRQEYLIQKDTIMPKIFKIDKKKYNFGIDYIITRGTKDENEFKANDIIFAGYGIADKNYDDYAGKNIKGKVVLIFHGEPKNNGKYLVSGTSGHSIWGLSINEKILAAEQKGAVAIFIINPSNNILLTTAVENSEKSNSNLVQQKNNSNKNIPVISIVPAVVKNIIGNKETAEITDAAKAGRPLKNTFIEKRIKLKLAYGNEKILAEASNIIGYIEGSDKKDEFVFLTSHYDHLGKHDGEIYYGADDDGSGTASVIEMAEAFVKAKKDGHGPKRSIVFMTVSGEEKGLLGSQYYAEHPVFPLASTTADLNIDMIGRVADGRNYDDSANYIYIIGDDKLSSDIKPITREVNEKYTKLVLDHQFDDPDEPDRIFYRSDHYNFAKKGVPIIFYFDGINKDYHKPSDTVDKINFGLMKKRVRYIFLTAWEIANRDKILKRDLRLPEGIK